MDSVATPRPGVIWVEHNDYEIVALNPLLHEPALMLEKAIRGGTSARPDSIRPGFFDIDLADGWAYVHIRDEARVAYLVAYFSSGAPSQCAPESVRTSLASPARIQEVASVLSRALRDDPQFRYIVPDEGDRRRAVKWFFQSVAIPASLLYGEIYTTEDGDGVALWTGPGRRVTNERMFRLGMLTMPSCLGPSSVKRYLNVGIRMESVYHQLARKPHWRLLALGTKQSTSNAAGAALVEQVLSRADAEHHPCYLETFNEETLPFYKSLGFRIEGAGDISKNGPNFWALMRPPHQLPATRFYSL